MDQAADVTKDFNNAILEVTETEALLMHRIANQDRKAFEHLYYAYTPRIGRFLLKLLKNPELVDEVVNEVMMTIWQNAARFDSAQGKLSTWLFGIAHNKALKRLERGRKYQLEQPFAQDDPDAAETHGDDVNEASGQVDPHNPERIVLGWELGDILVWALDQLSLDHRTVLELTFTEQCAYQEIADITGCPLNTVKTRMFHARKKLAELLARRGYSLTDLGEIYS